VSDDREIVGYQLVIDARGPNYTDRITLLDEDVINLQPDFVEVDGVRFERYGEPSDFVEVRADFVVARRLDPVYADQVAQSKRMPGDGGSFAEMFNASNMMNKGEKN